MDIHYYQSNLHSIEGAFGILCSLFVTSRQAGVEKPDTVDGVDIEVPEFYVSYKPQKIALTYPGTVRQFLHEKIRDSYTHPQFVSDVMKPLKMEQLIDQEVQHLSCGQQQRVAICVCLGKVFSTFTSVSL